MNKEKLISFLRRLIVSQWRVVALASGLAVSLLSFVPNIFIQSTVLVIFVPFFLSVLKIPKKQAYTAGLIFFSAWILPTTYWYYDFMPWWLAVLASVGYVTLIANLFHLLNIKKRTLALTLLCIVWAIFTYVRLRLPVMEDWWLPHLGYAAWSNPAVLWFGKLWGEASIELLILLSNAATTLLIWKRRYLLGSTLGGVLTVGFLLAGLVVTQQSPAAPVAFIALQQSVLGGIDTAATDKDVTVLMQKTKDALVGIDRTALPVVAVWPENKIPPAEQGRIGEFAKQNNIALAYHTIETAQDNKTYKKVNVVNAHGDIVLTNYKLHIAPGEIATGKYSKAINDLYGIPFSAYVCYDLHYPDAAARMKGASLVAVPLNDAAFGRLQKTFHAADIALRAAQASTNITVSSTTGPTMYVTKEGVVKDNLPYDQDGTLVIQ
jgi:apolipoprotein N-acyltransferase